MTDNQINKLPKNWTLKTLGEVCERIHYGYTASSTKDNTGVKLLRITDIQDYKVDWEDVPFCEISENDFEKYKLSKGDLLFARTGATVGKSFLIKKEIPNSVFASYLIRVIPQKKMDISFIYLFFQSTSYWSQIKESSVGIGQPSVNGTILAKLQIPLPPLLEQQKIVQKIESLFAHLETGTKALETALAQLKIYRQAVLNHFLTNDRCEMVRLKDINLFITDGDHQAPPKAEKGIPFVVISNIKNNKLDLSKTRFVTDEYYENLSEYRKAQKGDILYTVTGSYGIPVLLISDEKFCFQRHIGLLKPNTDKINREYLFYCLCSQFVFKQATNVATGTAQLTVPLSGLRNIKIPLPSLKIQTQIVSEIQKRMAGADVLEASLKTQLINAENLRQSILKRAFEGKLV